MTATWWTVGNENVTNIQTRQSVFISYSVKTDFILAEYSCNWRQFLLHDDGVNAGNHLFGEDVNAVKKKYKL